MLQFLQLQLEADGLSGHQGSVTRPGSESLSVVVGSVSLIQPIALCFTPTVGPGGREDPFQVNACPELDH